MVLSRHLDGARNSIGKWTRRIKRNKRMGRCRRASMPNEGLGRGASYEEGQEEEQEEEQEQGGGNSSTQIGHSEMSQKEKLEKDN